MPVNRYKYIKINNNLKITLGAMPPTLSIFNIYIIYIKIYFIMKNNKKTIIDILKKYTDIDKNFLNDLFSNFKLTDLE